MLRAARDPRLSERPVPARATLAPAAVVTPRRVAAPGPVYYVSEDAVALGWVLALPQPLPAGAPRPDSPALPEATYPEGSLERLYTLGAAIRVPRLPGTAPGGRVIVLGAGYYVDPFRTRLLQDRVGVGRGYCQHNDVPCGYDHGGRVEPLDPDGVVR